MAEFEQELTTILHPTAMEAAGGLYEQAEIRTAPYLDRVVADDSGTGFRAHDHGRPDGLDPGCPHPRRSLVPVRSSTARSLNRRSETPSIDCRRLSPGPVGRPRPGSAAGRKVVVGATDSVWIPLAGHHEGAFCQRRRTLFLARGMYGGSYQATSRTIGPCESFLSASWDFDRPVLVALDRAAWDGSGRVQTALSDSVIERHLPASCSAPAELSAPRSWRRSVPAGPSPGSGPPSTIGFVVEHADVQLSEAPETYPTRSSRRRRRGCPRRSADLAADPPLDFSGRSKGRRRARSGLFAGGGDDRLTLSGSGPSAIALRFVGGPGVDTVETAPSSRPAAPRSTMLLATLSAWRAGTCISGPVYRAPSDPPARWLHDGSATGEFKRRRSSTSTSTATSAWSWAEVSSSQWRRFDRLPIATGCAWRPGSPAPRTAWRVEAVYSRRRFVSDLTGFSKSGPPGIDVVASSDTETRLRG